jgi:hypothetical protein
MAAAGEEALLQEVVHGLRSGEGRSEARMPFAYALARAREILPAPRGPSLAGRWGRPMACVAVIPMHPRAHAPGRRHESPT